MLIYNGKIIYLKGDYTVGRCAGANGRILTQVMQVILSEGQEILTREHGTTLYINRQASLVASRVSCIMQTHHVHKFMFMNHA